MMMISLGYLPASLPNSINNSSAFYGALKNLCRIVNLQFNLPSAKYMNNEIYYAHAQSLDRVRLYYNKNSNNIHRSDFWDSTSEQEF